MILSDRQLLFDLFGFLILTARFVIEPYQTKINRDTVILIWLFSHEKKGQRPKTLLVLGDISFFGSSDFNFDR